MEKRGVCDSNLSNLFQISTVMPSVIYIKEKRNNAIDSTFDVDSTSKFQRFLLDVEKEF